MFYVRGILVLCHDSVCGKLDCLSLPLTIILIHYIDGIMLIGGQKVAATLDLLVRHLCGRDEKSGKYLVVFYFIEISKSQC